MTTVARSGLTEQEWLQRILVTAEAVSRPFPRVHRRYAEHRRADTETSRDALIDEVEMILTDWSHADSGMTNQQMIRLEQRRVPGWVMATHRQQTAGRSVRRSKQSTRPIGV
ncbi:hypothetical protein [Nocardia abscessus]|uniref:hypothetical protein n=1 Tax=Nocardia abscessus TaxID=120957 RepID=UPI002455A48E|nr:hypothetical protein [Nocardia abscessus]